MEDKYKSLEKKIDDLKDHMTNLVTESNREINAKLSHIEHKMGTLQQSLEDHENEIAELKNENQSLKEHYRILEGRLTRTEKVVEDLKADVLSNTARSMRDNLIFYKIPENGYEDTKQILIKFIKEKMMIDQTLITGIKIIRVHRLGGTKGQTIRPIVAQLNPEGVNIIMRHAKNLKGTQYGVNFQLPKEMAEQRKRLLPIAKEAREQKKKVSWSGEKLFVDSKEIKVVKDGIRDINLNTVKVAATMKVKRAPPKTYEQSCFQGNKVDIKTQDDIIPALHAIFSDYRVARATHNIYAYIIKTDSGYIEHFHDDGEYGAGEHVLKQIRKSGIVNVLVCVTRWYGGKHLGAARFEKVQEAAKNVIEM